MVKGAPTHLLHQNSARGGPRLHHALGNVCRAELVETSMILFVPQIRRALCRRPVPKRTWKRPSPRRSPVWTATQRPPLPNLRSRSTQRASLFLKVCCVSWGQTGNATQACVCQCTCAPPPPPPPFFLNPPPAPPTQRVDHQPPHHQRRTLPSKGEQVRTPGSTDRHTHSPLMAPPPPPRFRHCLPIERAAAQGVFLGLPKAGLNQCSMRWGCVLPAGHQLLAILRHCCP